VNSNRLNRRRFLQKTGILVGGAAAASTLGPTRKAPATDTLPPAPDDPTKLPGLPASAYGQRARFETTARTVYPANASLTVVSFTPLQDLHGIITPSSLHYERHHAGIPDIDPAKHRLLIHGMVKRPLILTIEELKRFPSVSRLYFLECSGNGFTEWTKPKEQRVQETHGLTSCSEWTGVLLSVLLQEVEVEPHAVWIVAEGADGAAMTRSLPLEKCMDDVIVAYGQNGEALQPAQGYPLRLVVPGWEGNISVKWLRRLKVVDQPYQTREETSKYTDLMPDGAARQFTFVMDAKSVITFPSGGQRLAEPGFYEIRGLAWSGRGRVRRVEVSIDNGLSWMEAELQPPVLSKCHTRFRLPWRWDGKETIVQSRCVDETGSVQPTREAHLKLRGTQSIYHYNAIQRWRIAADGSVFNA
jgi:sulfane dehydrogenase subunit SoxC